MPRKPTGRPRGRPKGSLLYPVQDNILLEVARLSGGDPKKEWAACQTVAPFVGGMIVEKKSKVARILRQYRMRRDWFLMRAKAPSAKRSRPRQNGPLFLTAYPAAVQTFMEIQQRFELLKKSIAQSPLVQEARRFEEQRRVVDSKGLFG